MTSTDKCEHCGQPLPDVEALTADRIHEILENWIEENSDWAEVGAYGDDSGDVIPQLGRVAQVEQVGGMDQGTHAHVVLRVGSRLFRKDGYHQSHDGTYYDGAFYEVSRREKTVTVYE